MSSDNANNYILNNLIKEEKLDRLDLDEINTSNNNVVTTNTNSNDAYDFNVNNDSNNTALVEDKRSNEQVQNL
jgi:hypothetical protein